MRSLIERSDDRNTCPIGLKIELSDERLCDALNQVLMMRYKGIDVSASSRSELLFVLRDAPGGMALFMEGDGLPKGVSAYFRYGERVASIVERIYELSGSDLHLDDLSGITHSAECIAFISSSGGCGTTALAKTMGRLILRDMGRRCLYISLAPYEREGEGLRTNAFTQLMYRLMADQSADPGRIWREDRGLFTIVNSGINPESGNLTPELLKGLLSSAGRAGIRYVILDIGNHLEKDRRTLLKECGTVISVFREGRGPAGVSCGGRTVFVENLCGPDRVKEEPFAHGTLRIRNHGRMDRDDPGPPFCEDVRRIMGALGFGHGGGKEEKGSGKGRVSGVGQDTFRGNGQRRKGDGDHRGMRL